MEINTLVRAISGEIRIYDKIQEIEWDFDHFIYKIQNEWYATSEVVEIPDLEIINVDTPSFDCDDVKQYVITEMFPNLIDFQYRIYDRAIEGKRKCFLYSIHTQKEPNFTIYFIRSKFI